MAETEAPLVELTGKRAHENITTHAVPVDGILMGQASCGHWGVYVAHRAEEAKRGRARVVVIDTEPEGHWVDGELVS